MPTDPQAEAALAASRQQAAQAVSSLKAMAAEIKRDHAQYRRERADRDQARAERARSGEAGAEAQEVQRRVDARETSWDDVLQGRDPSAAAQSVHETARSRVDAMSAEVGLDPEVAAAQAEAQEKQAEIDDELRRG